MMKKMFGMLLAAICFCSNLNASLTLTCDGSSVLSSSGYQQVKCTITNNGEGKVPLDTAFYWVLDDGSEIIADEDCCLAVTSSMGCLAPKDSCEITISYILGGRSIANKIKLVVTDKRGSAASWVFTVGPEQHAKNCGGKLPIKTWSHTSAAH